MNKIQCNKLTILVVICCFLRSVLASDSPAEGWDDFTNNFATDIAPLISLFGEQVTKQFLSESTGFLDNIIFGMAPLGIITAVVSAIRVYGWPGLKAFIGRAQEPHGVAEAELCSSTSRDVCELWSEGGICRVFGRPKVLEFFHKRGKNDFYPELNTSMTEREVEEPGACNIYQPLCFLLGTGHCRKGVHDPNNDEKDQDWEEHQPKPRITDHRDTSTEDDISHLEFAPYPNLSLNIGIRTTPRRVLFIIAILATLLQLSFFVYATVITFHSDGLYEEDEIPEPWAFILTIAGTTMVVVGMILCSFLIERKSQERRFLDIRRTSAYPKRHSNLTKLRKMFSKVWTDDCVEMSEEAGRPSGHDTTIYWLQPGNQRIGDQQFNAFSRHKTKHKYVTSWKTTQERDQLGESRVKLILVVALLSSIIGFVLQFIGLRGLHGSITLYQIAATFVMAVVRALLRQRQLGPTDNDLQSLGSRIEGQELDWQAMEIAKNYHESQCIQGGNMKVKRLKKWKICDLPGVPSKPFSVSHANIEQLKSEVAFGEDKDLECLSGFRNKLRSAVSDSWSASLQCSKEAISLAIHYECLQHETTGVLEPRTVARAALIRSRLAYLTGEGVIGVQPKWDSPARSTARELQLSIQGLANYVFSGKVALKGNWQDIVALSWHTTASVEVEDEEMAEPDFLSKAPISFPMFRYGREWRVSKHRLEAVLGLWDHSFERADDPDELNEKTVLVDIEKMKRLYLALNFWMPAENPEISLGARSHTWNEAWLVQERRLVLRDEIEKEPELRNDLWAVTIRVKSSRIKLLAQNIFTMFLSRLVNLFDTEDLAEAVFHTIESRETYYVLWREHFQAIVDLFVQSGLGTKEEAFACIVPVFIQSDTRGKGDPVVEKLHQSGLRLRREKKFSRAEVAFRVILSDTDPRRRLMSLREIGEVYRKAYRAQQEDWALRGLQYRFAEPLATRCSDDASSASALAGKEEDVLRRYGSLYTALVNKQSVATVIPDLQDGRDLPDIPSEYLLAHTLHWSFEQRSEAANLLRSAIKRSYPELIDDILETNPGLIKDMMDSNWQLDETMEIGVDSEVIETLLNTGEVLVNTQYANIMGETILSFAIKRRRLDIASRLIERGASVNAPTRGGSAIFSCIADEDGTSVSVEDTETFMLLLLRNGANVNIFNRQSRGETPVKRAVQTGNHRAVVMLIKKGANLGKQRLLNEAASKGDPIMLELLLDNSDINIRSEVDEPDEGKSQFVSFSKGFDPPEELQGSLNVTSSPGAPLHSAILARRVENVQMLLNGYCLNLDQPVGGSLGYAITMACFLGEDKIVSLLLDAGSSVNLNCDGRVGSALAIACARKDPDMAQMLLNKGACTTDGQSHSLFKSPLVMACRQGCDDIVGMLLKRIKKKDEILNIEGVGGLTPICAAVRSSSIEIVKMLINHGADVNRRCGEEANRSTPLEVCEREGSAQTLKSLLHESGADELSEDKRVNNTIMSNLIEALHINQAHMVNTSKISSFYTRTVEMVNMNRFRGPVTLNLESAGVLNINDSESVTLNMEGRIGTANVMGGQVYVNSDAPGNQPESSTRLDLEDL